MSDATIPAVVQDAQQYDWRKDLGALDGFACGILASHGNSDMHHRLAAYIEHLQDERDALRDKLESGHWLSDDEWYAGERANADFLRQYNALLAEHEAVGMAASEGLLHYATVMKLTHAIAERVIHGE